MESAAQAAPGLRAVEFYSGIGGLHYALRDARDGAEVVGAFDINELANKVYEHNFNVAPRPNDIGSLDPGDLNSYGADLWMLSPPCQPYTRQGLQLGSEDARAESFISLLDKLDKVTAPKYILVENVVGFETSHTRHCLVDRLGRSGYVTQEYLISPLDVGVPYSRLRYFCLAKLKPLQFQDPASDGKIVTGTPKQGHGSKQMAVQPLQDFILHSILPHKDSREAQGSAAQAGARQARGDGGRWEDYAVKQSTLDKYANAVDIVTPFSKRCCCFTKSYTKFAKGTGSLLAVNAVPTKHKEQPDYVDDSGKVHVHLHSDSGQIAKVSPETLSNLDLRYFTPREVANIHSFPAGFSFPDDVTLKQRYALLGNSLSVAVVSALLSYLLEDG